MNNNKTTKQQRVKTCIVEELVVEDDHGRAGGDATHRGRLQIELEVSIPGLDEDGGLGRVVVNSDQRVRADETNALANVPPSVLDCDVAVDV
jgi:hypothetical protein